MWMADAETFDPSTAVAPSDDRQHGLVLVTVTRLADTVDRAVCRRRTLAARVSP
jgi:hypothetical protein